MLDISLAQQRLWLHGSAGELLAEYPVSTALAGAGEQQHSGCTPRGRHRIRACIGAGLNARAVLQGRRPTGEIWTPELNAAFPQRDWILGRILWLCGEQSGFNRGGSVDSQRRYIYLHGTPDDRPVGVAASHGCIRLHPAAMVSLFAQVQPGMKVVIREN